MTVLVGYVAGKGCAAALHLAAQLARALHTSVTVVTVVPRPWMTPSPARIDAEFEHWAAQLAEDSKHEAQLCLSSLDAELDVAFRKEPHRSVSAGLINAAQDIAADVLVLGSAADGRGAQVVIGSTADRLLHSSPVPLAISPRGYRGGTGLTRITAAYPGTADEVPFVAQAAALADRIELPLRVVTFAIRGRTMYPPEVGLHVEDSILSQWTTTARAALAGLKSDGVVSDVVTLQVVTGNGWDQAVDATEWLDGEVLALGTKPRGGVAGVFLGSRGTKIIRYSPVPVLVLPG